MSATAPFALRELARTRAAYENGRFLDAACERLSRADADAIIAWAIETGQPEVFVPQTTSKAIAELARSYLRRETR